MTLSFTKAAMNEDTRRELLLAFDLKDRGYMTLLLWQLFPDDCPTPKFVNSRGRKEKSARVQT
jgi:hypothetical protein